MMSLLNDQKTKMIGFLMFAIFLLFLVLVIIISNNKTKRELAKFEYNEWMHDRGYIKIKIDLLEDDYIYDNINIITDNIIYCYIQSGVYNFVICKNSFSDIELYPCEPDKVNNPKLTKPFIINTEIIKSVTVL